MDVIEQVKSLIAEYLQQNGVELVDISYKRESGGMTLRLLVDTLPGISIAECEAINNFLSETLDRENVIDQHYLLEVNSPGLDRPIKTDRDFERSMGRDLVVHTYERVDDKKDHSGRLIGMDKENIVMESEGVSTVIPRRSIAMARLRIEV